MLNSPALGLNPSPTSIPVSGWTVFRHYIRLIRNHPGSNVTPSAQGNLHNWDNLEVSPFGADGLKFVNVS
jgi:hypothetical protein